MNLSGVVAVSGKSGLFKVLGQNKAGFLLQGLEGEGIKVMVSTNARLAALDETTVYGIGEDLMLKNILLEMQSKAGILSIPEPKAGSEVLRNFFSEICPEHDPEKVYPSDLKKIVSWYRIIENLPLFNEPDPSIKEKSKFSSTDTETSQESELENSSKSKEVQKAAKKGTGTKSKFTETHEKEIKNTNLKGGPKNNTHAVRKVNTGANKKAK